MSQNNHGLPFLPGYTFHDVTKSAFHRPHTLQYSNGFTLAHRPSVGIGQEPLPSEELTQQEINALTYEIQDMHSPLEHPIVEHTIPAYVALDKKVLRFYAYFKEKALNSPVDEHHIRPVVIYYYLEDDSMCILEPRMQNSGFMQGKRLKRQRFPKNEKGDYYLWKDLTIGIDLEVYGFKYRITNCDAFTKEFMEREGIIMKEPEPMPDDPYRTRRQDPRPFHHSSSDRRKKFYNMDDRVLRFKATWSSSGCLDRESWPVIIQYYIEDDSVDIKEVQEHNKGKDRYPLNLRRQRIPKKLKQTVFPSAVLEISEEEVEEYYAPKDFQLGRTVTIYSHHFFLYDCSDFTKEYFKEHYPDVEMNPVDISKKEKIVKEIKIPPYNGFGSLEDSFQNCLSLIPKPAKKNLKKMLDNKVLCYRARLDSQNPDDETRNFIFSYFLADDMIQIFEKSTRNSGFIGGKFLEKTRIPKPGSTLESPEFYSPADFAIGATIDVFSHRFVLTGADHNVLKYLESISSQVPSQTLDSVRQYLAVEPTKIQPDSENGQETQCCP